MRLEDWVEIYSEMKRVFERDKELTHIEITFNIKPVEREKKTAIINIKTYDERITILKQREKYINIVA